MGPLNTAVMSEIFTVGSIWQRTLEAFLLWAADVGGVRGAWQRSDPLGEGSFRCNLWQPPRGMSGHASLFWNRNCRRQRGGDSQFARQIDL